MAVPASLCLAWSEIPEDMFCGSTIKRSKQQSWIFFYEKCKELSNIPQKQLLSRLQKTFYFLTECSLVQGSNSDPFHALVLSMWTLTSAAIKAKIVTPICSPTTAQTASRPIQEITITHRTDRSFTWTTRAVVGENETCKKSAHFTTSVFVFISTSNCIFYVPGNL